MLVGFTGTRRGLTPHQARSVLSLLADLRATKILHGACQGADRDVHELANGLLREMYPSMPEQYRWAIEHCGPGDVVHPMPPSTVKPNPQIWRNHKIVERCDVLIACPGEALEVLRSGTWATIRYARETLVPQYRCLPDGVIIAPEGA